MNLLLIWQIKLETKMAMRRWAHKGEEEDSEYKTIIRSILLEYLKIRKYTLNKASLSRMQMDIQQFFDDYIIQEEIVHISLLNTNDWEKWRNASMKRKVTVRLSISEQIFVVPMHSDYEIETFYRG